MSHSINSQSTIHRPRGDLNVNAGGTVEKAEGGRVFSGEASVQGPRGNQVNVQGSAFIPAGGLRGLLEKLGIARKNGKQAEPPMPALPAQAATNGDAPASNVGGAAGPRAPGAGGSSGPEAAGEGAAPKKVGPELAYRDDPKERYWTAADTRIDSAVASGVMSEAEGKELKTTVFNFMEGPRPENKLFRNIDFSTMTKGASMRKLREFDDMIAQKTQTTEFAIPPKPRPVAWR